MGLFGPRKGVESSAGMTLYFASDIHGSDQCWRKFLGAGKHYGADAVIMGGDLTGKAIVPIEQAPDGSFRTTFMGEVRAGKTEQQLDELMAAIRFNGMYPWLASTAELELTRDDAELRTRLFDKVIVDELKGWMDLADDRMPRYGIDVFVGLGNDDPGSCDSVVNGAGHVTAVNDRIVRVGPHEMISIAYANPTPWDSPRELPEDELYDRIHALAEQVENPATAIFNLHAPPYDTGLDTANEMNEDLTLKYIGGSPHPIPVGSTAVRQIIEEYQPLLSLHGHIHESRGAVRIGRTMAINTGSEYNSGHIYGAVIQLTETEVLRERLLVG
ncbi:MAG: metallophosphoesterase [Actinomycetes bacterium]